MSLKEILLDGVGQGQVAGSCECGNDPASSTKCGEFLDKLFKDCAP